MIEKIEGTKNGYRFTKDATNKQLADVMHNHAAVKCILVNSDTRAYFAIPNTLMGNSRSIFTINNNVPDMEFYINTLR